MNPIHTSFDYPPIPARDSDWSAYIDPEGLIGHGATEKAAIRDLLEQMDERAAAGEPTPARGPYTDHYHERLYQAYKDERDGRYPSSPVSHEQIVADGVYSYSDKYALRYSLAQAAYVDAMVQGEKMRRAGVGLADAPSSAAPADHLIEGYMVLGERLL